MPIRKILLPAATLVLSTILVSAAPSPFTGPRAVAAPPPATCAPLGSQTVQAAAREACVAVPFGGRWTVDVPGARLTKGTGVSAVQLPTGLVWLAAPSPFLPSGATSRWTLFVTHAATPGLPAVATNISHGAVRIAVLPRGVSGATLNDAGDGVAVVQARLKDGSTEVVVASYLRPGPLTRMLSLPANVPGTVEWPVVRRQTVSVFDDKGGPVGNPLGVLVVASVRDGRVVRVERYRLSGKAAQNGWFEEGLLVGGRPVPGVGPLTVPRLPGFVPVRIGAASAGPYVIDVPATWHVRALPGASSFGVEASGPAGGRVTVWENGCVGCYDMDALGLVGGPDSPLSVSWPAPVRWSGDHTVLWATRVRKGGRSYVQLELVTVPPEQGTYIVTVTVPAGLASLARRIVQTFRWS